MKIANPKTVWMLITDICNNKCRWCYEQGNSISTAKTMSMKDVEFISVFMQIVGIKKCIIIGGEPTLHPNFLNILSLLKERDILVSVVTNGRRLSILENVKKIKELNINGLSLSAHGWSSKTYADFTSSSNGFNELVKAIDLLQNFDVKFSLNFVLSRYSEKMTKEIIKFVRSCNVRRVNFNLAAPAVSPNSVDGSFVLSMDRYRKHVMDIYYECKLYQIHPSFLLSIPHCIFTDDELLELFSNQSVNCGCHLLRGNGIIFCSDGSVALCNHLLDFKVDKGDIPKKIFQSKESFSDFWNSYLFSEIRKSANCYRSNVCIECNHWPICGGGCLIHWSYHDPLTINYRKVDLGEEVMNNGNAC